MGVGKSGVREIVNGTGWDVSKALGWGKWTEIVGGVRWQCERDLGWGKVV